MATPFRESVIVHRRTAVTEDGDGNDVATYTDETVAALAVYDAGSSSEQVEGRDLVSTGLTVVFQPPVTLAAVDQITARGNRWEVLGDPSLLHSPFTATEITQVKLQKVTG